MVNWLCNFWSFTQERACVRYRNSTKAAEAMSIQDAFPVQHSQVANHETRIESLLICATGTISSPKCQQKKELTFSALR